MTTAKVIIVFHRKIDAHAGELAMLGDTILRDGVDDHIRLEISEDNKFGKRDSRIVGPFYPEYSRFVGYE